MPRAMRQVNRVLTNRLVGPLASVLPPLAVVHHVGRKSGREYRTPVIAYPVEGGMLTPLPYGTDTDWLLNLVAAGRGYLERFGGSTAIENPRVVGANVALPLLPALVRPVLGLLDLPGFLLVDEVVEPPA